jgi:hypothetical protein
MQGFVYLYIINSYSYNYNLMALFIINFKETANYYEKHLPVMHCHMHRCFIL